MSRITSTSASRALGQPDGVVEEQFVRADLEQDRREAGQVCVDSGGEQRLTRVLPGKVHGRGMQQRLAGEEGVDARLGVHALSGHGVVEPGGERHDRGGHREARVAGGEAGRHGVAAAAGVPGERDGRWVFAAVKECAVRVAGPCSCGLLEVE
jgi:hypothetical protein